ncbi:MAG: hypothetical protein IPK97_00330 [Ahniella sp.]|nr:hypothetical protein [Ahniella sp.]
MSGKSRRPKRLEGSVPPSSAAFANRMEKQKRSDMIWLVVLGAAVATPLILMAGKDMQRNLYQTREDCVTDYSESECPRDATYHYGSNRLDDSSVRRYHGPWFEAGSTQRTSADPGPGRQQESSARNSFAPGRTSYRPPVSREYGIRGGFGRSGAIRAGRGGFGG